jgi:hypothetical protein
MDEFTQLRIGACASILDTAAFSIASSLVHNATACSVFFYKSSTCLRWKVSTGHNAPPWLRYPHFLGFEGAPYSLYRGDQQSTALSHTARTPVGRVGGFVSRVRTITASIRASSIVRGVPD